MIVAETSRLILRELTPLDAPRLFEIYGDPDVMRFMGPSPASVDVEREGVLRHVDNYYRRFGYGLWAVIEKTTGVLRDLVSQGAVVRRGDKELAVHTFKEALDFLLEDARGSLAIQRYKGLGEMNPEQLWETTMDPAVRRLLKVQIEDAVASDDIFDKLMGEAVEPRRNFIESNALGVRNLDV